ncbi:DUF3558 domain-containing protein [Nonomuraea phyllanthi]|uniref:DUF3558 domain-containing protein n=1 Tax=Nonomuraea phyllanthi TaxID=2219224 RepID=A0A5C4WIM0_9ACTN|nr:DUF3558 family protein [Nonomuraea phyllanthi]KAB8194294.1 DUF3558 domain-containing protein [Nonomuraea phyllanthi]
MTRAADEPSTRKRPDRAMASVVALFLASCAVAACGTQEGSRTGGDTHRPSGTTPTSPAASAAASGAGTPTPTGSIRPSATAADGPLTLAELAQHPCRAIDDEDARKSKLWIFVDGTQPNYDTKSCQWGARGGLVTFTPYTSTDQTKAEKFKHLTRKNISGHQALLGSSTDHGRETYVLFVSVGRKQSFRLMVLPWGEDVPGPDAPTLATNFAKAILSHLR